LARAGTVCPGSERLPQTHGERGGQGEGLIDDWHIERLSLIGRCPIERGFNWCSEGLPQTHGERGGQGKGLIHTMV
jgi:hypothetical protein